MGVCRCGSTRKSFNAEIALHFPGLDGLKKPIVWLFPSIETCLNCGTAEFVVPERERIVLLTESIVDGSD